MRVPRARGVLRVLANGAYTLRSTTPPPLTSTTAGGPLTPFSALESLLRFRTPIIGVDVGQHRPSDQTLDFPDVGSFSK